MGINADDSVSYEESTGGKNFFAIRKVYEASLDGRTWYRAGDEVYYDPGKKEMMKSTITKVEYDGSVLVENEKGIFSCSVAEIKSGRIALGKASDREHEGVLAVRYLEQFTVDLTQWYSKGQSCIIRTAHQLLVGVEITNVMNNGNICISCDGIDDVIHYSEIIDISDYCNNVRYLLFGEKPEKNTSVIIQRHVEKTMMECS